MELIPIIAVKGGKSLWATARRADQPHLLIHDPIQIAKRWQDEGAQELCVWDVDGARVGMPQNRETVRDLLRRVHLPILLVGGIRTAEVAQRMLGLGASQVVFDADALADPLIGATLKTLDAKAALEVTSLEQARNAASRGARRLFLPAAAPLASRVPLIAGIAVSVIVAGELNSLDELAALKRPNVVSVLLGKALYDGKYSLTDAYEELRR